MPKNAWCIVCLEKIEDREKGTVSLIHVVEVARIQTSAAAKADMDNKDVFVLLEPPAVMVSLWRRNNPKRPEGPYPTRVTITPPNGANIVLDTGGTELDLTKTNRFRLSLKFSQFPVRGDGVYQFAIELKVGEKWISSQMCPIDVTFTVESESSHESIDPVE